MYIYLSSELGRPKTIPSLAKTEFNKTLASTNIGMFSQIASIVGIVPSE